MTKTTTLSLELAVKMYQGTDEQLKAFALENYPDLGKEIQERVKTFEDACLIVGISPTSNRFTDPNLFPHEVAMRKIETIVQALNEGWKPNLQNLSEYKYYPWFKRSSSGSGFSFLDGDCVDAASVVGARQYLKSSELAVYAGKQFTEIYKVMLTQ